MRNHFVDAVLSRGADGAPFLVEPNGTTTDYAEMRRRVCQMANVLAAAGVRPGERVAAQIAKSPAGLMLYLATLQAGAAFLPINTAYTSSEVAYFLRDADPCVVVCDPAMVDAIAGVHAGPTETLDAAGQGSLRDKSYAADDAFEPIGRGADDLAAILYTSGTTGRAKGAMLTHGNLVSNAETLAELWRFSETDRLLHALPIYHTHGLFTALNTLLVAGASALFLQRFETTAVIEGMAAATVMMGVPTFYTRLLADPAFSRTATRGMRLFISGSAPLRATTHQQFAERTGHAILERYGMTETNMTASNPYDGERRAGTVGFPLPQVDIRIVDETSRAHVAKGEIGVIEVRGRNVFKGYWRDREKTADSFRPDGFFITGDLGRIDGDGYLHISGRSKDLIIAGGLNVYPKEIELALDALPGVLESAVIGVPHPDLGEGVTAVVVAEPGARLSEACVLAALDGIIANFKRPKRVLFVAELPRNAMSKVQKSFLREQFADIYGRL